MGSSATGSGRPGRFTGIGGVAQLRVRGARGGVIPKHRSMRGLQWTPRRVGRAVLLSLGGFVGVVLGLPALGRFYTTFFERALDWLGLPGAVAVHELILADWLRVPVPYLELSGPWPATWHWLAVGGATLTLFLLSFLLPVRLLPARYFLRFVAMVQTVSLVWFAVTSPPFLYPLPGYLIGFLSAGLAVLTLVPLMLGISFYIFDHTLGRQLLLTVLLLGHLGILLPLQTLIHGYLVHHLSALVQPTLFFVFGLLVQVLVFVAFYGWAMSWPGTEIAPDPAPRRSRP